MLKRILIVILLVVLMLTQVSPSKAAGVAVNFKIFKLYKNGAVVGCNAIGQILSSSPVASAEVFGKDLKGSSKSFKPLNTAAIIRTDFCEVLTFKINDEITQQLYVDTIRRDLPVLAPDRYLPFLSVGQKITANLVQPTPGGPITIGESTLSQKITLGLKGDVPDVCIELTFGTNDFVLRSESCNKLAFRNAIILNKGNYQTQMGAIFEKVTKGPEGFVVISQQVAVVDTTDFEAQAYLPTGIPFSLTFESRDLLRYPELPAFWDGKCVIKDRTSNFGVFFNLQTATYGFLGTTYDGTICKGK